MTSSWRPGPIVSTRLRGPPGRLRPEPSLEVGLPIDYLTKVEPATGGTPQGTSSRLTRVFSELVSALDLLIDSHVNPRQEFGRQPTEQAFEFLLDAATLGCCSVVPSHRILRFWGHLLGFVTHMCRWGESSQLRGMRSGIKRCCPGRKKEVCSGTGDRSVYASQPMIERHASSSRGTGWER